ncbi:MAG TPA: glutamate 5-kinase [Candidatus Merdisoma faecalis]|uniref:glutamate 5-kinase n=1 Tax=Lachnoclostridium sp. An138 TaxID=1965560 RepID=UPI000B3773C2|nr:glutamate 5-kinase [Lachnoclostridium sp. An138]OUQ19592.1 glutamate 5-kinase [Lachnoclostridium sp. An138]HIR98097.1 glutamate 5-kinase [Candidatus Merdisoma faecalis]
MEDKVLDTQCRAELKDKKRIVVKVGTSSLIHVETGELDLIKVEHLVRELTDLRSKGKDVILVTSGAIGVGSKAAGFKEKPDTVPLKQACAAIGQARLMMIYQKFFAEYNQVTAQVLMTRNTMLNANNRRNAQNTFEELLALGAIPVVNANDSISTFEILHGDNDTLSAVVVSLVGADLLILLSDINGLYTDNPSTNPDAKFVPFVDMVDDELKDMGKESASGVGTGGMATKLIAAELATSAGADMVIANGRNMNVIHKIIDGQPYGTFFRSNEDEAFELKRFLKERFHE